MPLIGYFMTNDPKTGLLYSSILTILFLFVFGYVKTKLTGESPFKGALKTVLIGVLAAAAAFGIAHFIA